MMKNLLFTLLGTITLQFAQAQAPFTTPDNIGGGNCLDFDGTNDWIEITSPTNLPVGGSARTIEAWINIDNTGCGGMIASYGNTAGGGQHFIFYTFSNGFFGIFTDGVNGSNNINNLTAAEFPNSNEWNLVSFVLDGANNWQFYVNGNMTRNGTFPIAINTGAANNFRIGIRTDMGISNCNGSNPPFHGLIDEVRIWNVARTPAQIRDNMCTPLVGNETGLVGYWNMNEGTGNTVTDLTSNNNHGTRQ